MDFTNLEMVNGVESMIQNVDVDEFKIDSEHKGAASARSNRLSKSINCIYVHIMLNAGNKWNKKSIRSHWTGNIYSIKFMVLLSLNYVML